MTTNVHDVRLAGLAASAPPEERGAELERARGCLLEEALGAVMGAITLWYLGTSLAWLA